MTRELEATAQSVYELLKSGTKTRFVIPDYQRPYAWGEDQCLQLWEDLRSMFDVYNPNNNDANNHFLGSVVIFDHQEQNTHTYDVIDGQQRITTLVLLLRAIYRKLKNENENFLLKLRVSECIWGLTQKASPKFDYTLIDSKVALDDHKEIFNIILQESECDLNGKDHYSKNYRLFKDLVDSYASESPIKFPEFVDYILNHVTLLPVIAKTLDTALTIFSTLNDRGIPLSDADIIKAKIYKMLTSQEEKEEFVNQWKIIERDAQRVRLNVQDLFAHYIFYLRARNGDSKSTSIALRKVFTEERLADRALMDHLKLTLDFLCIAQGDQSPSEFDFESNVELKKCMEILSAYPNSWWKYPALIYFILYREEASFVPDYISFLHCLISLVVKRYIEQPTLNRLKPDILKLNVSVMESMKPKFNFTFNDEAICNALKRYTGKATPLLLKLLAYNDRGQTGLLPKTQQVEHLLPKKYAPIYKPKYDQVKEIIDYLGNKILLEKKLNIRASNNCIERKREAYRESSIAWARTVSEQMTTSWSEDAILERSSQLACQIMSILNALSVE